MAYSMLFLLNLLMILEIHLDTPCIEDREEQHPWLEIIKNLCAIAIEWIHNALDKIDSKDDPREFLDIY